jgi:CRP-like cAMP-binding protein
LALAAAASVRWQTDGAEAPPGYSATPSTRIGPRAMRSLVRGITAAGTEPFVRVCVRSPAGVRAGAHTARITRTTPLTANHLIESLPNADRARLLAICEPAELTLSEVLCEPGAVTRHVYFPTGGFVSLVTLLPGHPGLEVGMVGREGMVGAQLVLGVTAAPLRALVQGSGAALRIGARIFRTELARSPALQRRLGRYLYVLMAQLATSAGCLRYHSVGPRLARWLLMTQDRAQADTFHVTHEFLAYMLGVRRAGVTGAATAMQRGGLIRYSRGTLTVVDRSGLEAAACSCYAIDCQRQADSR